MSLVQVACVVLGNSLLAGLCLGLAFRTWQLRCSAAETADQLEQWCDIAVLSLSQTNYRLKQEQLRALIWQQDYAKLKLRYQQTRQLLALIRLVQMLLSYRTAVLVKSPNQVRR